MIRDIKGIIFEVVQAVFPLSILIILLMFVFVGTDMNQLVSFLTSTLLVTFGMIFFLLGVKIGILPIGEAIGADLPKHNSLMFIAIVTFLLSFLTTVAEPDVRVLSNMINLVSQNSINNYMIIISIASGVGFFVVASIFRIIYGIPIRYLFTAGYLVILILSFFVPGEYLAISFDAGGVTTGSITVPVIMALGIGTVAVLQNRSELSDGFGLMGFASMGPIISLMLLGVLSS